MSHEKRRADRKDIGITLPVWIDRCDGSAWEGCAMEDVSDGGAKLKLLGADTVLPQQFIIRLSLRDQKGKLCMLRWRRGNFAGVQYVRQRAGATAKI
jgi:hypothetical protein